MNTSPIVITETDRANVREAGGRLTYRPLAGNRFRCNQLPHLGPLTQRQCRILESQLASPPQTEAADQSGKEKPKRRRRIDHAPRVAKEIDWFWGELICPHCSELLIEVRDFTGRLKSNKAIACRWCKKDIFIPETQESRQARL